MQGTMRLSGILLATALSIVGVSVVLANGYGGGQAYSYVPYIPQQGGYGGRGVGQGGSKSAIFTF